MEYLKPCTNKYCTKKDQCLRFSTDPEHIKEFRGFSTDDSGDCSNMFIPLLEKADFLRIEAEKPNYPSHLRLISGRYYNAESETQGFLLTADFEENIVEVWCGNNFYWRGTGQDFEKEWKLIDNQKTTPKEDKQK